MTNTIDQQIADIRQALFEGRLTDASQTVDHLRTSDPHLNALGADFANKPFNVFGFQCWSTSPEYVLQQLRERHMLVLSWLKLSDQLNLFNVAIEHRDVNADTIACIKLEQLDNATRKTWTNLVGYWLSHQKFEVVERAMDLSGVSIKDICNHPLMMYGGQYSQGSVAMVDVKNVPMYWSLGFNYTPQMWDFVCSHGVTVNEIATMLPHVQASKNPYAIEELKNYKATRFEELKSKVERINISAALNTTPALKKKKM